MKVANNKKWRISSRDLFKESCEHCTRIDMAVAAGVPEVLEKTSPFNVDVSALLWVMQGNEYERYVFDQLKEQLGDDFIELEKTTMHDTLDLLRAGTPVVAQGYLERQTNEYLWSGFPDLLIREDFTFENGLIKKISEPNAEPKYVVWDVKASSEPDEKYWIQVASYSEVLAEHGLASETDLGIIAKYGETIRKPKLEALDQLEAARNTLLSRLSLATPDTISTEFIESWRCEKPTLCEENCSFPGLCKHVREEEHSLFTIYGTNPVPKYEAAGIRNYDDLIDSTECPDTIKIETYETGKTWARLLKTEKLQGPYFELKPKDNWLDLPTPTPDDLFFDIEWFNPVLQKDSNVFMFGYVDAEELFESHDSLRAEDELPNFQEFVSRAKNKMESNPLARIYHFHNPEVLYLRKLATKHNQLHDECEFLISRMVDLRKITMSMILPGANSYSIKKLERYYDADTKLNRKGNLVEGGADAMLLYYKATVLEPHHAEEFMTVIRDYNKDDCLSTKLLRDWLLSIKM